MKILKPILGSVFAAVLLLAAPAHAKKVTMNIGYSVNEGHPYGTFMHLFAERFQTLSGGTVRVKVHCCHKMGDHNHALQTHHMTSHPYLTLVVFEQLSSPHTGMCTGPSMVTTSK